ncbi:MAG: restriction endonuclease subunit S [Ardenticatenaceae bacterium]|nr:restriction endonuclease subunit S [Ardenticatenaceae bacterium]
MEEMELPEGWKVVPFKDLAKDFGSGGTPSTKEPGFWDGPIPWTTSAPIGEDDIVLERGQRFITEKGLQNSATRLIPKGSLLVGTRVGVGKAVLNLIDIAISQDLTGVRLHPDMVAADFVAYQFKTETVQNFFEKRKRGTTIKGVSRFDLQSLVFRVPPLPEQRAIARALRAVQEARATRQREAALERERKAALMEHLFRYGTRGEATKETEIGEVPESWRVVRLGDLIGNGHGAIQTGPFGSQLHASDYRETGIPVVNPTHLSYNMIVEDHLPFIDKETADKLSKHYLSEGDILISRRGDFSRYSYITQRYSGWLCGTGCLLIRLNHPEMDNYFLAVSIGTASIQNYLKHNSVGSIMPNLNTKILQGMPVLLPTLPEQVEVATVLRAFDAKIDALEQEITLLDELFHAMLEELMTGRLSAVSLIDPTG